MFGFHCCGASVALAHKWHDWEFLAATENNASSAAANGLHPAGGNDSAFPATMARFERYDPPVSQFDADYYYHVYNMAFLTITAISNTSTQLALTGNFIGAGFWPPGQSNPFYASYASMVPIYIRRFNDLTAAVFNQPGQQDSIVAADYSSHIGFSSINTDTGYDPANLGVGVNRYRFATLPGIDLVGPTLTVEPEFREGLGVTNTYDIDIDLSTILADAKQDPGWGNTIRLAFWINKLNLYPTTPIWRTNITNVLEA